MVGIITVEKDHFPNFKEIGNVLVELINLKHVKFKLSNRVGDDFGLGMYVDLEIRHKKLQSTVYAPENGIVYEDSSYNVLYERMFKFLELSGYENTAFNRTLMQLLHELGHVHYFNMLEDHALMQQHRYINDVVRGAIYFSLMHDDIEKMRADGVDTPYLFRGDEMYADAFAMKYFIASRNRLVKEGFVND